jgi:hypothetical protein
MPNNAKWETVSVVVASPKDVAKERDLLKTVIDDVNENMAKLFGIMLELQLGRRANGARQQHGKIEPH